MSDVAIKVENISKVYQDENSETLAIKNFTYTFEQGRFTSIVGPSGCGKSTLLSVLANLEKKSGGNIKFFKDDFRIGYMLQKDCLFPWLTILDNCLLSLKI